MRRLVRMLILLLTLALPGVARAVDLTAGAARVLARREAAERPRGRTPRRSESASSSRQSPGSRSAGSRSRSDDAF